MTANYHTPLAFAGPLTSAAMEAPLDTLDARISRHFPVVGRPDAMEINPGAFANPWVNDLYVASALRVNPVVDNQAASFWLRISGNMGGKVHDAVTAELRVYGISNAAFLNALEATGSIVGGGGAHTIPRIGGIVANLRVESAPTGTITDARVIFAQHFPPVGTIAPLVCTNLYGLYVDEQNMGVNNWSIYAPTGTSRLGIVETDGDMTIGILGTGSRKLVINGAAGQVRDIFFSTAGTVRWVVRTGATAESGANAGSDLSIEARTDAGVSLGAALAITRSTLAIMLGTGPLGFFGTAPSAKAAITGSRGANAALASLLTQLAAKGLITDSSTA